MLYGLDVEGQEELFIKVLILIFLENALRRLPDGPRFPKSMRLNPYFFGKCSTAELISDDVKRKCKCLNPYFFGKCSTASKWIKAIIQSK